MGRSAASIQAEIDIIEAELSSSASVVASAASRGTQITRASRKDLSERLDRLYQELGRANGTDPMFARGVVTGLRSC